MKTRNFMDLLHARWDSGTQACVGLDPNIEKFPEHIQESRGTAGKKIFHFMTAVVDAVTPFVCALKPNIAFFAGYGIKGLTALQQLVQYINERHPEIPVILDAKRADIGNTNKGYVKEAFEFLGVDAITLHPWLGQEALKPFLDLPDKGCIILCRTSNPGAGEFQDLKVLADQYMYLTVANHVSKSWNGNGNCGLVVGATCPGELKKVRDLIGPDIPILIPGIGAQGGDLKATVKAGKNSTNQGMIINSSRAVLHASSGTDFAEAAAQEAKKLRDSINEAL